MRPTALKITLLVSIFFVGVLLSFTSFHKETDDSFITRIVDLQKEELKLYWKNDKGEILNNFENLKTFLESKQKILVFAMNAGMYKKDYSPQGLYIDNQKTLNLLDVSKGGNGNFYLKPNGVFYITTSKVGKVCQTADFVDDGKIKYATQSGPMLVIDGKIHSEFKDGSKNINIRNGVGILTDNKVVFVISKVEVNFYDFANYFKELGCKNALYLDGFVSRVYTPEKNLLDAKNNFGVMIGVTKPENSK